MTWRPLLDALRGRLPLDGGLRRGSLRWLEAELARRGHSGSAVRNIVYRDVGTAADRQALFGLLAELHREAGLPPPAAPWGLKGSAPTPELLGRSKRLAARQFLTGLAAGRRPRLVVTGRPGVGKTLLLDHLAAELDRVHPDLPVTRLDLSGDLGALFPGSETLRAGQPYSVQAAIQAEAVQGWLRARQGALLVRVREADFGGLPVRDGGGESVPLAVWAYRQLLAAAPEGLAVFLALDEPTRLPPEVPVLRLRPPSADEVRRHLLARLSLAPGEAEALMRAARRDVDRLDLLAAAHALGAGDHAGAQRAARDPDVQRVLAALVACGTQDSLALAHFEAALGSPVSRLPQHARALLHAEPGGLIRPAAGLLTLAQAHLDAADLRAAHERSASGLAGNDDLTSVRLRHLAALNRWDEVAALADPPLAAEHWSEARRLAPTLAREALAREVVRHHTRLGAYDHEQARDALSVLLESQRTPVRAWARLKLAEAAVERGAFDAARAQLSAPEFAATERPPPGWDDPGVGAALVQAAVARWQGDLASASHAVESALRAGDVNPRVRLWRGLIAKDRGDWPAAARDLAASASGGGLDRARARYQEGDLRLRLGLPASATQALEDALESLDIAHVPDEERARVTARLGTALRRAGRLPEAEARLREAAQLARHAEPVLRARVLGERIPLLLALGRADEGLQLALRVLGTLEGTGGRAEERAYRLRRTRYRLALALLTRGLGVAYLPPLAGARSDHPDLAAARALLAELMAAPLGAADREQVLLFDMHLSAALAEPDAAASLDAAQAALAMTDHPYAEAQARAILADRLLHAADPQAALAQVNRAHALLRRVGTGLGSPDEPDPGLAATLVAVEVRSLLALSPESEWPTHLTWAQQSLALPELAPFRPAAWRELGRALEAAGERGWASARAAFDLPDKMPVGLRLPDLLISLVPE